MYLSSGVGQGYRISVQKGGMVVKTRGHLRPLRKSQHTAKRLCPASLFSLFFIPVVLVYQSGIQPLELNPNTFLMEHSANLPSLFFIPVVLLHQSGIQSLEIIPDTFLVEHLREFVQTVMPVC